MNRPSFSPETLAQLFKSVIELQSKGITTPEQLALHEKRMENYRKAYDRIPELFFPVHMLYVPIAVGDHYITAFVDTGAAVSIMNEKTALLCGLEPLIHRDDAHRTMMVGVGSQRALGKLYYAEVEVGGVVFECGFTVMKDSADVMIGLDILKLHRCQIDLGTKRLIFGQGAASVPFLESGDVHDGARMITGGKEPTLQSASSATVEVAAEVVPK